jgi:hypothetical protein
MGKGWDGTSASFTPDGGAAVTIEPLRGTDANSSAREADVGGSGDDYVKSRVGRSDKSITLEFAGSKIGTLDVGDVGALEVDLNDGEDRDYANCAIAEISVEGSLDGPTTGSMTFVKTVAPP